MRIAPIHTAPLLCVCFLLAIFSGFRETASAEPGPVPSPLVSDIRIDIAGGGKAEPELTALAKRLIRVETGKPLRPDQVNDSLGALKKAMRFEKIHVDTLEKENQTTVLFRLTPFPLVEYIRIRNAFPLFKKDILKAMTLNAGNVLIPESLSQQAENIKRMLSAEGYPSPAVHLTVEPASEPGNVVLDVRLEKGPPLVMKKVVFQGNRAFSGMRLRYMMKTPPSLFRFGMAKRFKKELLKKDIQTITEFYRLKGFGDGTIDPEVKVTGDSQAEVIVNIHEGPRYTFLFSGNKTLSSRKLKKTTVHFRYGNKNDRGLKKIATGIKEQYREAGFMKTRVAYSEKKIPAGPESRRVIRFTIEEGKRKFVESVHIRGNRVMGAKKIEKQMLTAENGLFGKGYYSPETLQDDIFAITALYLKEGFMDPDIRTRIKEDKDEDSVSIHLSIDEKVQTLVSSVEINGLSVLPRKVALEGLALKEGTPFREYILKSDENTLSAMISEKGRPFVEVKGTFQIRDGGKNADVTFHVSEGKAVHMGEIFFQGNFRTRESVMIDETGLHTGEPFSLKKMLLAQKRIQDLGLFESVRFNPLGLAEKWEEIQLLASLEEKKPYFMELETGYETGQCFFMAAKGGDRNLFGKNKNLWAGLKISQIGYNAETGFTEPRLFGTKMSLSTSLYSQRTEELNQNFGTAATGANVGFSLKPFQYLTTLLNFRFEERDQFGGDGEDPAQTYSPDEFRPRTITVVTPSVTFDARDSFIQPRRGFYGGFSMDLSRGIADPLDNFIKYQVESRYYYTPAARLTFAWIGRGGMIQSYGSTDKVPDDQLFFLGGISDVRGFEENMLLSDTAGDPLGGRTFLFGSMEARFNVAGNVEVPLFIDTGKISRTFYEGASSDFRYSAGLGLRYLTPVGPVGLLYGKNLDSRKGESSGVFHISVGYTF